MKANPLQTKRLPLVFVDTTLISVNGSQAHALTGDISQTL